MNYSAYALLKISRDASPQDIMHKCEEYCQRWNMKDIRTQLCTIMSAEEAAKANVFWRHNVSNIVKENAGADTKENVSGGTTAAGNSVKKAAEAAASLYDADVTVDDSMAPPLE